MKKLNLIIGLVMFISIFSCVSATDYYINNTGGSDSDAGTSPSVAWKSLDKVTDESLLDTFNAGDNIYFAREETFFEDDEKYFRVSQGDSTADITISSYGVGNLPVFGGTLNITCSYTEVLPNIWNCSTTNEPRRIWINETEIAEITNWDKVNVNNPWSYNATSDELYIYSNGQTPDNNTQIRGLNASVDATLIITNSKYLKVSNINFTSGYSASVALYNCTDMTFENNAFGYNSYQGFTTRGLELGDYPETTNIIVKNNIIDSGFNINNTVSGGTEDGINVGCGSFGNIFEYNFFKGWGHSAFYINCVTTPRIDNYEHGNANHILRYNNFTLYPDMEYGRGINLDGRRTLNNTIIYNYVYNTNTGNQINGVGTNFSYNIIDVVNNSPRKPTSSVGKGIDISTYCANCDASNITISHNTIMNTESAGLKINDYSYNISKNIVIKDNIFINCGANAEVSAEENTAIYITNTSVNNITILNNVIYNDNLEFGNIHYRGIRYNTTNPLTGTNNDTITDLFWENPYFINTYYPTNYYSNLNSTTGNYIGRYDGEYDFGNNLELYYNFDKDESTAYDFSNNDRDKTISGAEKTSCIYSNCFDYDGIDDIIDVKVINTHNKITYMAWVKNKGSNQGLNNNVALGRFYGAYSIGTSATTDCRWNIYLNSTNMAFASLGCNYDTWHNLAVTWNGFNYSYYLDGVVVKSEINESLILTQETSDWEIGSDGHSQVNFFFNGSIDEVMIFNKSLNPEEILDIYTNKSNRSSGFRDPIYYSLDAITTGHTTFNITLGNFQMLNFSDEHLQINPNVTINGTSSFLGYVNLTYLNSYINTSNNQFNLGTNNYSKVDGFYIKEVASSDGFYPSIYNAEGSQKNTSFDPLEFDLTTGWNIVTQIDDAERNFTYLADFLGDNVTLLSYFNANNQTYTSFVVGSTINQDFNISYHDSYYAYVTNNKTVNLNIVNLTYEPLNKTVYEGWNIMPNLNLTYSIRLVNATTKNITAMSYYNNSDKVYTSALSFFNINMDTIIPYLESFFLYSNVSARNWTR